MGLVNFGVPEKEVEYLKNILDLNIFVEGGTYKGGTAKNMSNKFSKVYTVEKSDVMHSEAEEVLKDLPNVTLLKGDTRTYLPSILEDNNNILFWLDAHWSGGDTYGENDECPLIEELNIIFKYDKNHMVLIDDARLFLAPPPHPHNHEKWPSIIDITKVLPVDWELVVFEDVIYLFPEKINNEFSGFLQKNFKKNQTSCVRKLLKKMGM